MTIDRILASVADQINAGAIGPNVTASVSPRVRNLAGEITEAGFVEEGREFIKNEKAKHVNGRWLPPAALDELHALRGGGDDHQWAVGRKIEQYAVEYAGKIPLARIWKEAAGEIECSKGQVRRCHETWLGTDDDMRETFDVLTFQHFYVAVAYCRDRAARMAALRWCVETADQFGGRPAPAGKLEAKLKKAPDDPTYAARRDRAVQALEAMRDATEDDKMHDWLNGVIDRLGGMQL